jgi:hypothetical protein
MAFDWLGDPKEQAKRWQEKQRQFNQNIAAGGGMGGMDAAADRIRRDFAAPPDNNQPQQPQQQAPRQVEVFHNRERPMFNYGHIPAPAEQAALLDDMGDQAEKAIGLENYSRVSQMRERERMNHELDLEAMRRDALLARLQQFSPQRSQDGEDGVRVFDPASGMYVSAGGMFRIG